VNLLAASAASAGGGITVTQITEILLVIAAFTGPLIPWFLRRRQNAKEALAKATAEGAHSADATTAAWTALNAAQQAEMRRLQGAVDRLQARVSELEGLLSELQRLATPLGRGQPGA
jgi:hypothetical protein